MARWMDVKKPYAVWHDEAWPELSIGPTVDGTGFLTGRVTIRLFSEPVYFGVGS
jgi:hypothetical protein